MKGETGTSLGGTIVRGATKRVPCDCWHCGFHRDMGKKTKGKYFYCTYYDIFEPRKKCARYTRAARREQGQKRHDEEIALRRYIKSARKRGYT